MRVVSGLLALGFCSALAMPACAAPFDGKWIAEMAPQGGDCNYTSTMMLVIADGAISGQIRNPGNTVPLDGHVDANGNGTITVRKMPGTLQFSGDHLNVNWFNGHCNRQALGDREPTDDQIRQMAARRSQVQATFADLTARAESGDAHVDYTALRNAYPYTEQWDPYGNKTGALLQQADAAKKGGDCTSALPLLDQVIKADFTIDAAHSLRADCLEDSDHAKSKIEAAIADGLIKSLMDSGDGDTEKTAYVVNTAREELDVLANRHIQLKTKQTEVRGSNGHFYDEIQGISVRTGGVSAKTVYFDVGSFVAGRQSHAAAITMAAVTVH